MNASVGCWQCLKTHTDLVSYRQHREWRRSQFSLVSETLTLASCFTHHRRVLTAPANTYLSMHTKRNLLRCGCSNKTNADESSFSESLAGALLLEQSFWCYSGGCWAWHLAVSGFMDKIAMDPVSVWFIFPYIYFCLLRGKKDALCIGQDLRGPVLSAVARRGRKFHQKSAVNEHTVRFSVPRW